MWLALLASLALGAALVTMYEPAASAAAHERVRCAERPSRPSRWPADLAARLDWSALPGGDRRRRSPTAARACAASATSTVDLLAETTRRTCGRPTPCDDAATTATTDGRPWGARNPAGGSSCTCRCPGSTARRRPCAPAISWRGSPTIRPTTTATATSTRRLGHPGHGVVLVRGAAFASGGAVAEVEALVAQPCRLSGAACPAFACSPGARWARAFLDRSAPGAYHRECSGIRGKADIRGRSHAARRGPATRSAHRGTGRGMPGPDCVSECRFRDTKGG